MGILESNALVGRISGKVGGIVFAKWKQVQVIRTAPGRQKKRAKRKESLAQLKQRSLLKKVSGFMALVGTDTINLGYQQAKNSKISPLNAAASYHMLQVFNGKYPDFVIDYKKVKLSRPIQNTEQSWNTRFTAEAGRQLRVEWELNPFPQKTTRLDDIVMLVFINVTAGKNIRPKIYRDQILRSELQFSLTGAHIHIGDEICGWMFFRSADGKRVSETEYLGKKTILE